MKSFNQELCDRTRDVAREGHLSIGIDLACDRNGSWATYVLLQQDSGAFTVIDRGRLPMREADMDLVIKRWHETVERRIAQGRGTTCAVSCNGDPIEIGDLLGFFGELRRALRAKAEPRLKPFSGKRGDRLVFDDPHAADPELTPEKREQLKKFWYGTYQHNHVFPVNVTDSNPDRWIAGMDQMVQSSHSKGQDQRWVNQVLGVPTRRERYIAARPFDVDCENLPATRPMDRHDAEQLARKLNDGKWKHRRGDVPGDMRFAIIPLVAQGSRDWCVFDRGTRPCDAEHEGEVCEDRECYLRGGWVPNRGPEQPRRLTGRAEDSPIHWFDEKSTIDERIIASLEKKSVIAHQSLDRMAQTHVELDALYGASGAALDRMAKKHGVVRKRGEPDVDVRERVEVVLGVVGESPFEFLGDPVDDFTGKRFRVELGGTRRGEYSALFSEDVVYLHSIARALNEGSITIHGLKWSCDCADKMQSSYVIYDTERLAQERAASVRFRVVNLGEFTTRFAFVAKNHANAVGCANMLNSGNDTLGMYDWKVYTDPRLNNEVWLVVDLGRHPDTCKLCGAYCPPDQCSDPGPTNAEIITGYEAFQRGERRKRLGDSIEIITTSKRDHVTLECCRRVWKEHLAAMVKVTDEAARERERWKTAADVDDVDAIHGNNL